MGRLLGNVVNAQHPGRPERFTGVAAQLGQLQAEKHPLSDGLLLGGRDLFPTVEVGLRAESGATERRLHDASVPQVHQLAAAHAAAMLGNPYADICGPHHHPTAPLNLTTCLAMAEGS